MTESKYIRLTRPDGGRVYVRRDAIDYALRASAGGNTQISVVGTSLYVRETPDDIMRDID